MLALQLLRPALLQDLPHPHDLLWLRSLTAILLLGIVRFWATSFHLLNKAAFGPSLLSSLLSFLLISQHPFISFLLHLLFIPHLLLLHEARTLHLESLHLTKEVAQGFRRPAALGRQRHELPSVIPE